MDSANKTYKPYGHDCDPRLLADHELCPSCDLFRAPREFQGLGERFVNCATCRSRGASREVIKKTRKARA